MDGFPKLGLPEKIRLFEAGGKGLRSGSAFAGMIRIGPDVGNLLWQVNLHHMPRFAAFEQAQSTVVDEPAHRRSHCFNAKASASGNPGNGEAQPQLPFEAAVPQEVCIDGAVARG